MVEILARLQFAMTISFHYIYPPLSIGLGLLLVFMEGSYLYTKDILWRKMAHFWTKIFALTFSIGVATGIVMEFEFGTNWAAYSRYVGDIFGSALAAEGIFAFFLESGFLGLLLFGWDKIGPRLHFFATCMVCLGSHFSAVWIVVANSWMQTPGIEGQTYRIVDHGLGPRVEILDFWSMVFNPSSVDRLVHVTLGAWLAGAFLVISVSAYYMVKKRHQEFSWRSMKVGAGLAAISLALQLVSGHSSAKGVSENQPIKMAAMEGHYHTGPADLYLFGWPNDQTQEVDFGVKVPGMLSWMLHQDRTASVPGLDTAVPEDRPKVAWVFQCYHVMIALWAAMVGLLILLALAIYKRWENKWIWRLIVCSVFCPQIANQAGWFTAELGRQPWIVQGLMRTSEGLSKSVKEEQILFSIILFGLIYLLLFALFIFLLDSKIKAGPEDTDTDTNQHRA